MEFRDLLDKYDKYLEIRQLRPIKKTLPEGYVVDENQSVKWNREYVEQHNKEAKQERYNLMAKANKAYKNYTDSILDLISSELNCDIDTSIKIYNYVYEQRDWDDQEEGKLDAIEEAVELIKDIRENI